MTSEQAAKILGCEVGDKKEVVQAAYHRQVLLAHPDTRRGHVPIYTIQTLQEARDALINRKICKMCGGLGWTRWRARMVQCEQCDGKGFQNV